MRICYVSAGAFAHVGTYLEHFRSAGHDVHFIALSPSPPRSVPIHATGGGGAKWRYLPAIARARAVVRALKPDVLHAHYATSGGLAALASGHPRTIVTAHGTDLTEGSRSPAWRPLLRAVLAGAARVNTVSADLTRIAVELGADRKRVVELTPGVDMDRFRPEGRSAPVPGRPLRLLCTRRLEPAYDPRTIVSALGLAKARGLAFEMTFAGDGVLRAELEALSSRLGLGSQVRFAGELPGAGMPELLRSHDAFLSASLSDGASLSLLEAMSAGLYPVVSRIPANLAWLRDGEGGLLHAPGDSAELASRLLELARRPERAAAAATFNRARVAASGDRAVNMARLERVYEELARAPVSRSR